MPRLRHNQLVRSLQVFNHLLLLIGMTYAITAQAYHYLLTALVFYWVTGVLGINIGMHRLLSHRSFRTWKPIEWFLSLVAVITTVGSPLAWTAIHRQHHRTCERPGDPHSPYLLGNWRAWFGFWNYVKLDLKLVRDMRQNSLQRWLHRNYFSIILVYCVLLAWLDPWLIVFVYAIPACLCLHSTSAIIVIAHRHGYRTHDLKHDQSRNSWIANIITLGEGWHNNHHARPHAWSNWERWWEWDIPAMIISMIKKPV